MNILHLAENRLRRSGETRRAGFTLRQVSRFPAVPAPSFSSLNESQQLAASHVEGPLLVLAGPGSGKTRVVTHRIAHLIAEGVPPERIVALTFTNKAADEMRRRVAEMVGPQPVEMGTIHRFAARLIRRQARLVGLTSDYSILDPDDAAATLKRAVKSLGLAATHTPVDRIAGVISRAKNDLLTPSTFEPRWGKPVDDVALRVWPVYQQMLVRANAVDFDDLLVHVATILAENPELRRELDARHRFILVDEYQDTNAVQYAILRGLSIDHPHLAVTGDPDQAIYGWRGASIRNILEFERDYPAATVVKLEDNYRSTANILGTAEAEAARHHGRPRRAGEDRARRLGARGGGADRDGDPQRRARGPAVAARLRDPLPGERSVAFLRARAANQGGALPARPRPRVLQAARDPRRGRLAAAASQSPRR